MMIKTETECCTIYSEDVEDAVVLEALQELAS